MRNRVVITVVLSAAAFAIAGPWLTDALGMKAVEMGLDSGQGATVLDHLGLVLLYALITPFVFVVEFFPAPRILFALNGACWACACWAAWKAWHGIRRRRQRRNPEL